MQTPLSRFLAAAAALLVAFTARSAEAASPLGPILAVDLGPTNRCAGLEVPSGGDGTNEPAVVDGNECRRMVASSGLYLYVRLTDPAWRSPAPRDLYATFEILDDGFTLLRLQYDKQNPQPSLSSKYADSPDSVLLTGSGKWRRAQFALPAARLGGGENHGADFRLVASGAAIRRIELSNAKPAGYGGSTPGIDPEALAAIRVQRSPGMEFTVGNDANPAQAALYRALSVSSVESYVDWAGVEPRRNEWDWRQWDEQVRVLREAGLKWVPFLIAGPAYATPLWFQNSPESVVYRCLEHGEASKVQTLFNPALRPQVDRFLAAFAAHYRDSGMLESVLLGPTGIFGESLYPAGHADGGWTGRLTGPYHNHLGWWAGDPLAVAAFRAALSRQYSQISGLNQAWGTHYASFDEVAPFLPAAAPSDRARYDLAEWYQQAMTEWAAFWVAAARKHLPDAEIYLCTGGAGDPVLGADFTAQAKAIAPYRAGIRITNEGSDFARNFTHVREALSATALYGTFAGFEPAAKVNAGGIAARIYGATTAGARQLHDYTPNLLNPEAVRVFRANAAHLLPRQPRIEIAVYASRETWNVDGPACARWHEYARLLRDVSDYHVVTRTSVADGALKGIRVLILPESPVLEPAAAAAIETWVRAGGILIAATRNSEPAGSRLFDHQPWRERLFIRSDSVLPLELEPRLAGPAPASWTLHVGSEQDRDWLFGDWHSPENATEWLDDQFPEPKRRWTGASAGVYLPACPNTAYTLRVHAYLSGLSLKDAGPQDNAVLINGQVAGHLSLTRPGVITLEIPASLVGNSPLTRLEFAVKTWNPSAHGSTDNRDLGLMVHRIDWDRSGPPAVGQSPAAAAMELGPNPGSVRQLRRRVDAGCTLLLPGAADQPLQLARVLAAVLKHPAESFPGLPPFHPADGRLDERYATAFDDGVLWFEAKGAQIRWSARDQ